jgi:acetate kinase
MNILVINCGSSSIKYKFYQMPQEKLISRGIVDRIGEKEGSVKNHRQALEILLRKIERVDAIGHRVVHGAEEFKQPALIDQKVIRRIRACSKLAPLHNPANLEGILACRQVLKGIKQAAVFDTAFYQSLPQRAFVYGLPYNLYQKYGIRKYGFHGASHEYVALEAARTLKRAISKVNLITCHLGNGCSVSAIKNGRCIDTSMGFTPLEGLVMGTRCGDIDPALITYLIREKKMPPESVDQLLNKESGLKGISGVSNDMRKLKEQAERGNKRCQLAIEIFIYRLKKYISAYLGILGRADALVFTAGIAEHHPWLIRKACKGLFNNLKAKPKVMIIPTDEELMIARQTYRVIRKINRGG